MAKFRKKPVVIEAEQWFPGKPVDGVIESDPDSTTQFAPFVETLEGPLNVSPGDWIITGIKGEKYPCKPDIFEATYESAAFEPAQDDGYHEGLAKEMYAAYAAVTGWKNFRGDPMPKFGELPQTIQSAWEAAARQAFDADDPERFRGWTSPRFR